MRKLLVIIVSFGVLWGGYWFVGSSAVERSMVTWLSGDVGGGWKTEYTDLKTKGFPNRFDTTIRDIHVQGPNGLIEWSAPFFQIFALSYKPNHIIAAWPNRQSVTIGRDILQVTSERMRGSVVFKPNTALTLDRSSLEITNLGVQSNQNWFVGVGKGQFHTRQTAENENSHDVSLQLTELLAPEHLRELLDPKGSLPKEISSVNLGATVGFDAPLDRFSVESRQPKITDLNVKHVQVDWGKLSVNANGLLTTDAGGFLQGTLEVTVKNWRELLSLLKQSGIIHENLSGTVESIFAMMALEAGGPDTIVAEWVFEDGRMRFGAIPLGPAPRL